MRSFVGFFVKNRNGKSVFGLRRREQIASPTFQKTTRFADFASLFVGCFSQEPFFLHFFGTAAAKASKMAPKRVALLGPEKLSAPCFSGSAQCFSGSVPKREKVLKINPKRSQKGRKVLKIAPKMSQNYSQLPLSHKQVPEKLKQK